MDKFEINIDKHQIRKKPPKGDRIFGRISNRVAKNKEILSIEEIIYEVGEHYKAFTRANMCNNSRNDDSFEKQIFLVLDFDENPNYEKFKEKCQKYRLNYTFTYRSLRWSKENQKFRAVFVLDDWIKDSRIADVVNNLLLIMFDDTDGNDLKADQKCKELCRMFLGGKKVIEAFPENRISIRDVWYAFHEYFRGKKDDNYGARLKTVAKDLNVAIINNELAIYEAAQANAMQTDLERVEDGNIVMFLPESNKKAVNHKIKSGKSNVEALELKQISGVAKEKLMEICPLFKEFAEKKRKLTHDEKFILATNLRFIKGGKNWFFEALLEIDDHSKWKRDWKFNSDHNYMPCRCSRGCPYAEECDGTTIYSKFSSKIRKLSNLDTYLPLANCNEQLKTCLREAVDAKDDNIYVIKAQTALGKTEAYCNIIQESPDKQFIIAVPTCKLQAEVVQRLKYKGIECTQTESVYETIKKLDLPDLEELVKQLYDGGFGQFVVKQIREYKTKNYDKLTEYQCRELNRLTGKKQELKQSRCIVTTHAYFQMMKLDTLEDYEIIIDEDFLVTLFKRNWSLSLDDVQIIIAKRLLSSGNTEKLKQILDMKDQETQKIAFTKPNKYELEKLYERTNEISGPLPLLLESSYVVMDRVHEEIMFCKKFELPPRKMIILSASVNEKLYEDVPGGGERVRFWNVPDAKYKGHVIQYTAHTMSRKCIKTAGTEKVQEKVKEIAGDVPVISFKMIDTDLDIHFGKTEGFDNLKGKDIAIVGTPHNRPALYKLLGEALGYNTAGNITNHRVERNNYEFRIMTFADKSMRNLQLFLIETELEQAIGRARVLREDCTVYVFSNYPCKQAELNMEPYLDITVEEETGDEEEIKE